MKKTVTDATCAALAAMCIGAVLAGCGAPADAPPAPDSAPSDNIGSSPPAPRVESASKPPPEVPAQAPHEQFFARIAALCGQSFAGYLTVGTEPSDRSIGEADLTIRVGGCTADGVDIAFDVGADRSRTWQLRRAADRLALHHDHRDPDGTAHTPTGYGGYTQDAGTAARQAFAVDADTLARLPATRGNVWSLEIRPGESLAYNLERPADDRFFRVEFDLTAPRSAP